MASHVPFRGGGAALVAIAGAASCVCGVAGGVWTAVETSGAPPRFTAVGMAMMEPDNALYVFGSKNEFWRHNMTSRSWEDLTPTVPMPWDGRVNPVHYVGAFEPDRSVYVFSGEEDVFRYDASLGPGKEREKDAWTFLKAKNTCVSAVSSQKLVFALHQGLRKLYAFRGAKMCSYLVSSNSWVEGILDKTDPLWYRGFGPIAPLGWTFYIFASTGLYTWTEQKISRQVEVRGPRPPWREGAAMVAVEEERALFLFGGSSTDGYLNDLWRFGEGAWTEVPAAKPWPAARAGAFVAAPLAGRELYLFGGNVAGPGAGELWLCDASMTVPATTTTTTWTVTTTTTRVRMIAASSAAWVAVGVGLAATAMGVAVGLALSSFRRPARDVGMPEQTSAEMALTASRH